MSNHVFVTDSQMRSALAVVRSLGKKGIKITAGEVTRFSTGSFSKYCAKCVVYPDPSVQPDKFKKYIQNYVKKYKCDLIFPMTDSTIKPILDIEDELSNYTHIALPSKEIFFKGYDKASTIKIAIENNIPVPKTIVPDNSDDIFKFDLDYPIIIKPRFSYGKRGFMICHSIEDLINKFDKYRQLYGKYLIQEFIPNGGEFGVYTLFNSESELRALSIQRRIRSFPVSGGSSTLRETFRDDMSEKALQYATTLLKAMNWFGVAMVEFRIDPRDGTPKLMEVNPRFWGSLQLSILAEVDFPYLLYRMVIEGDLEPMLNYKEGIKCRWILPGDILWYFSVKNKIKNARNFFDRSIPDDIISWDDPGPTFGFILATLRYLFDIKMWRFILRR